MRPDPEFGGALCFERHPIDVRTMKEVKINGIIHQAFPELCYLGDMPSAGVVASWLSSHASNTYGKSSANFAICSMEAKCIQQAWEV